MSNSTLSESVLNEIELGSIFNPPLIHTLSSSISTNQLLTIYSTSCDIRITLLQKDLVKNTCKFFYRVLDLENLKVEAERSQLSEQTAQRFVKALVFGLSAVDDRVGLKEDEKEGGIILSFPIVPTVEDALHDLLLHERLPCPPLELFDSYHIMFQSLQQFKSTIASITSSVSSIESCIEPDQKEKEESNEKSSSSTVTYHESHRRDIFNPLQGVLSGSKGVLSGRGGGGGGGVKRKR